jgi:hypothetical protein
MWTTLFTIAIVASIGFVLAAAWRRRKSEMVGHTGKIAGPWWRSSPQDVAN